MQNYRPYHRRLTLILVAGCALVATTATAAEPRFGTHIPVPGPAGGFFLAGTDRPSPPLVGAFFERAGGGPIRVIRIASTDDPSAGRPFALRMTESPLRVRSRADADAAHWPTSLDNVAGLWLDGDDAVEVARFCRDTTLHGALIRFVSRGGTLGAVGPVATTLGGLLLSGAPGLDLLPGTVILAGASSGAALTRLETTVNEHPDHVGFAIDRQAALVMSGRRGGAIGRAAVVLMLARTDKRPPRVERLLPGTAFDVIALSRAAVARAQPAFPPAQPGPPTTSGTLFIGGGGRLPREIVRQFVAAAGGPTAPIVVIPTALGPRSNRGATDVSMLRAAGARNVTVVDVPNAQSANQPSILNPLRRARGLWFSGGRQWRLVDSYLDTLAHELMLAVAARGGAIGGSSAGASIQGDYMVRGDPIDNRIMMAEGYERGLGFLPGTAIDQHFSQRGRLPDMAELKSVYPQLLGIGIDEDTTAIVRGSVLEVSGPNRVLIYHGDRRVAPTTRTILHRGDRYDLVRQRKLTSRGR